MSDTIYLILHIRTQSEYTERRHYFTADDFTKIIGYTEDYDEAEKYLNDRFTKTAPLSGNIYWTDPEDTEEYVPEGENDPYNPWRYEIEKVKRL